MKNIVENKSINIRDIQIRDPFILNDKENNEFVLYGTTDKDPWNTGEGFLAYRSHDLEVWKGPYEVFEKTDTFWGVKNFWAPEVWYYKNKYYMFATFCSKEGKRGTQILVSNSPVGKFKPHSEKMITPETWMCLDGTLHVDQTNTPWLVFCREWTEVHDGRIYAVQLSEDLTCTVGEPTLLFNASDAAWPTSIDEAGKDFITDGPFLTTSENGALNLLWSSSSNGKYSVGQAISYNGSILGPWVHLDEPLLDEDAGHCMIFDSGRGKYLVAHAPNDTPNERVTLFEVLLQKGEMKLK